MDAQLALAEHLESLGALVRHGNVRAVFAVAIADDGPNQVVLVEPEDREALIIAINEEVTRMLGTPHHIVSTDKLAAFLAIHKISEHDLLNFQASQADMDR